MVSGWWFVVGEADMTKVGCAVIIGAVLLVDSASARAQEPAVSPAHVHIGHVMTGWKDTPDMKGFLPVALADAQIAAEQAERADLEGRINDFVLYGGYVLNALDPSAETAALLKAAYSRLPTTYVDIDIPGSGYGVKRAVAGALQHVQLAAKAEGASDGVKTHAMHVAASLENVAKWTDAAIALAKTLLTAADAGQGQPFVDALFPLTVQIVNGVDANKDGQIGWQTGEGGLRQAQTQMRLMMKGEGMQ
jgi:hypothetical protein